MASVPVRDLRNDTASVLRLVEAGEAVTITLRGRAVAKLVRVTPGHRRWLSREDLVRRLRTARADAGLRADLDRLAGDTTDDLGPIR